MYRKYRNLYLLNLYSSKQYLPKIVCLLVVCLALSLLGVAAPYPTIAQSADQTTQAPYWPTNGWRTSTPEAQGMSSAQLNQMIEAADQQHLSFHSILVIRHGYIVSETYFAPYTQDTKHELYSVTKSFISTLVGIAADQGYLKDLNKPVVSFFPQENFQNLDASKQAMTVDNLLSMTSGLDWQEGDSAYMALYRSSDWVKYVMDEPMKTQPGTQFNYCSGCSHILSAIVQTATKTKTSDYAQKNLFDPLGITDISWETDASGIPLGGWGLELKPRDMAKLGYLYLHNGQWDGRQIVSESWVKTATQKHITASLGLDYGYQWWLIPFLNGYSALGRYGQTILVIPKDDLIVVTTARIDDQAVILRLIAQHVIPAVLPLTEF